jgi:hypothetical protein
MKTKFFFQCYDLDSDGYIGRDDLSTMYVWVCKCVCVCVCARVCV